VPFGFLRRRPSSQPAGPPAGGETAEPEGSRGTAFDALTEEWRLVGTMHVVGRLSDVLNRRETVAIGDVRWAPIDDPAALAPVPGLKALDPYDLIVVLAGPDSVPPMTDAEREAHRVHKVAYDVALEAPPFRVVGTVHLYPGSEPERLLDRATEMFVPATDAYVFVAGRELEWARGQTVLVNRSYLRGIEQIDRRTLQRVVPLPGQPLGGTSWRERAR